MNIATTDLSKVHVNRDHLECVQGEIPFVRRTLDEQARGVSLPYCEGLSMVSHDVTIRNARPIIDELSLDREGFALAKHKISCVDDHDPEVLCPRYLEEMLPFIKERFNASWVIPMRNGVIVRRAGGSSVPGVKRTGPIAHVDFAPIAAPMLAARENQEQGLPIRSYSRLMIVQAWRALSSPPQDFPLALCDSTTVLDTDIIEREYTSDTGASWKQVLLKYNPIQRWYYFPEMTSDEVILWKGFDSDVNSGPGAPHTGFDNRRAHPHAKQRESIEARFYVYWA